MVVIVRFLGWKREWTTSVWQSSNCLDGEGDSIIRCVGWGRSCCTWETLESSLRDDVEQDGRVYQVYRECRKMLLMSVRTLEGEDIQQIRTSHKRRKNRAGIKEKR